MESTRQWVIFPEQTKHITWWSLEWFPVIVLPTTNTMEQHEIHHLCKHVRHAIRKFQLLSPSFLFVWTRTAHHYSMSFCIQSWQMSTTNIIKSQHHSTAQHWDSLAPYSFFSTSPYIRAFPHVCSHLLTAHTKEEATLMPRDIESIVNFIYWCWPSMLIRVEWSDLRLLLLEAWLF